MESFINRGDKSNNSIYGFSIHKHKYSGTNVKLLVAALIWRWFRVRDMMLSNHTARSLNRRQDLITAKVKNININNDICFVASDTNFISDLHTE